MSLPAELTFASMRECLPRADALAGETALDLSGIRRIDSAGAAFLLELTRLAARSGRTLNFTGAPDQVKSLLEFLQIDGVLKLQA